MIRHFAASLLAAASFEVGAADLSLVDLRYCGPPPRDEDGVIMRRRDVLREFQRLYACPSTGKTTGACKGWAKDHIIPLAVGGCDAVSNLQWLPDDLKSCPGDKCKDRWERKVYLRDAGDDDDGK